MNEPRPVRPVPATSLSLGAVIRPLDGSPDLILDELLRKATEEGEVVHVAGRPVGFPKKRKVALSYAPGGFALLVASDDEILGLRKTLVDWFDTIGNDADEVVSVELAGAALIVHVGDWLFPILRTDPPPAYDEEPI